MSHLSHISQKELDQELRTLSEYPIMKPKGTDILPVGRFLNMFVEAGSVDTLEKKMPKDDISFDYYFKWADGFKAITRELDKNKALNEKIKNAPQEVLTYLNCISLTLRLTKKTEDIGKYVPDTIKWHQVAEEYKALYNELLLVDPEYAKIFLKDITKPIYEETPEAVALAEWGHYQALNYLGLYHQQQSIEALLDPQKAEEHNSETNRLLNKASSQGSNQAMQIIGSRAIYSSSSHVTPLNAMASFRINYEISARRGNAVAMVGLGFSLLRKHDVLDPDTNTTKQTREKIELALQLLYRAAREDATMAHVHLAGHYYTNDQIDKAIEHYQAAVTNEHIPSMLFLARIYMKQCQAGLNKIELMLHYYKMAMTAGNIEARFHLATIYSNTVHWLAEYRNNVTAFAHAFTTANMKFEDITDPDQRKFVTSAKILLGDFYRDGTTQDGQKDTEKSIEWYKAGVHDFETHPEAFEARPEEIKIAYYQLGAFYLDRWKEQNSDKDFDMALDYFQKSAKLGHIHAMQIQTQVYEESLTEFTAENALERIRMHEIAATQAFFDKEIGVAIVERKKIAALYGSLTLNPKPDYKKAMQVYSTLIQSHQDVEAAYFIAKMYQDGKTESGNPDFTAAARYYTLCIKYDQSSDKKYTRLAYLELGQIAAQGSPEKKPNYKMAAMYYDKVIALKDPIGHVEKGLLKFKTLDPDCPPAPLEALAHFRQAKKIGYIFTPEDLHEITEELEKFKESHKDAYFQAINYDFQLLLDNNFIDKLLNEITTTVHALRVYPPFLIADTVMETNDRLRFIDQYLSRLIEIGTAYKCLPHTEETISIMIEIEKAIASCAGALSKPEIQYPAHKNLVRLHLLHPNPDYVDAKHSLDFLIDQYLDPESAYILGQMEEQGHNATGQPDYQAALKAYELGVREATPALPTVQCFIAIGNLAYIGKGMPENKPNLEYALKQYRTVANMGYYHAYVLIGLLHLTHTDPRVPVNIDLAMAWLRQADDHVESSPDTLTRIHEHLEILKSFDHLKESHLKAISYDVRFLEDYLWLSNLFFSPGCKPSEEEKGMIPKYIKWIQADAHLDDTDRENLLNGFKQYYKDYLPKA